MAVTELEIQNARLGDRIHTPDGAGTITYIALAPRVWLIRLDSGDERGYPLDLYAHRLRVLPKKGNTDD